MAIRVPKYAKPVYAWNANLIMIAAQMLPVSLALVYSQLLYVLPEINRVTETTSKHATRTARVIHHPPAAVHVQVKEYVRKILRDAHRMHCDAVIKHSNPAMLQAAGSLKQHAP